MHCRGKGRSLQNLAPKTKRIESTRKEDLLGLCNAAAVVRLNGGNEVEIAPRQEQNSNSSGQAKELH